MSSADFRLKPEATRTGCGFRLQAEVTAIALSAILLVTILVARANQGAGYDLIPLPIAGRLMATGQADHLYAHDARFYNLVNDTIYNAAGRDLGFTDAPTPFVYPPLIAVAMQPLADVPFGAVRQAWTWISIALMLLSLWLIVHLYLPAWLTSWKLALALLGLTLFEPLLYSFWLGQTTAIILPCVVGALALQRANRPWLAGLVLACAVFVKLTPAAIALVWAFRGPWRAFASAVIGVVALWALSLTVAGVPLHVAYVARMSEIAQSAMLAFNNHSLLTFSSRLEALPSPFATSPAWLDWTLYEPRPFAVAASTLTLLMLTGSAVAMGIWSWRDASGNARARLEAMALLLMLLAPNIAWTHYFVFLLPIAAVVLAQSPTTAPRVAAAVALALCTWPLMTPQHQPGVVMSILDVSLPTIAAFLVWGAVVSIAWSERRVARHLNHEEHEGHKGFRHLPA